MNLCYNVESYLVQFLGCFWSLCRFYASIYAVCGFLGARARGPRLLPRGEPRSEPSHGCEYHEGGFPKAGNLAALS